MQNNQDIELTSKIWTRKEKEDTMSPSQLLFSKAFH